MIRLKTHVKDENVPATVNYRSKEPAIEVPSAVNCRRKEEEKKERKKKKNPRHLSAEELINFFLSSYHVISFTNA